MGLNELNANEEAMGRKKLRIEPVCTHTHSHGGTLNTAANAARSIDKQPGRIGERGI